MKKLLKSDKLIILIVSICIIGILSIAFFLVGPFIRDKFTRLENFKYHYVLEPGIYEIGTHIPEGTYYVRSDVEETCYFDIYELAEDYMYCRGEYQVRDKNKLMQPTRGMWRVEIKNRKRNINLENGKILMIRPNAQLLFYSNDANNDLNRIRNSTLKTYKLVNRAVAGQDFKTGVYDIIYEPTDSEQNGTVACVIKFYGTYESEFTMTFHCSGKEGSQLVYKNVPFTSDSTITTKNIQGITLVPTKIISEKFKEITGD